MTGHRYHDYKNKDMDLMNKILTINNTVIYYPGENKLQNILHPEKSVILNEPSARCLDILLASDKEFVTHKELYTGGWISSSQEPSPNTLYQNILLIRRGLKEVSDGEINYIITVPRKGFYFNKSISVSAVTAVQEPTSPEGHLPEHYNSSINHAVTKKIAYRKIFIFLLSAIMLSGLVLFFYFLTKTVIREKSDFFDNYTYIKSENSCDIYINKSSESIINEKNKDLISYSVNAVSCNEYPYRYITISRFSSDFYFFSCNKKNAETDGFRCISTYYQ
ncbi:hypothetical protein BFD15_08325 [Morganella morganii]|nr:hypothetical protein BFD15_08325 [Morganella morganii]